MLQRNLCFIYFIATIFTRFASAQDLPPEADRLPYVHLASLQGPDQVTALIYRQENREPALHVRWRAGGREHQRRLRLIFVKLTPDAEAVNELRPVTYRSKRWAILLEDEVVQGVLELPRMPLTPESRFRLWLNQEVSLVHALPQRNLFGLFSPIVLRRNPAAQGSSAIPPLAQVFDAGGAAADGEGMPLSFVSLAEEEEAAEEEPNSSSTDFNEQELFTNYPEETGETVSNDVEHPQIDFTGADTANIAPAILKTTSPLVATATNLAQPDDSRAEEKPEAPLSPAPDGYERIASEEVVEADTESAAPFMSPPQEESVAVVADQLEAAAQIGKEAPESSSQNETPDPEIIPAELPTVTKTIAEAIAQDSNPPPEGSQSIAQESEIRQ